MISDHCILIQIYQSKGTQPQIHCIFNPRVIFGTFESLKIQIKIQYILNNHLFKIGRRDWIISPAFKMRKSSYVYLNIFLSLFVYIGTEKPQWGWTITDALHYNTTKLYFFQLKRQNHSKSTKNFTSRMFLFLQEVICMTTGVNACKLAPTLF